MRETLGSSGAGRPASARLAEHLKRYGICTPQSLSRAVFPSRAALEAAWDEVSALLSAPLPLPPGGCYFQACDARPWKPLALARAYAMLTFCLRHPARERFLPEELPAELVLRGKPAGNFYYEHDAEGGLYLGYLVIDTGQHYRRIVRKCESVWARCQDAPFLQAAVTSGRFRLAVVTISGEQRGRIRHTLRKRAFALTPEIVVLPELLSIAGGAAPDPVMPAGATEADTRGSARDADRAAQTKASPSAS